MAQWSRIHLPMQETWVWSLIREDPTCHGATKPMCHTYSACALVPGDPATEPMCSNCWSPQCPEPVLCNKRSHHIERPVHHKWGVAPAHRHWRKAYAATKTQHSQKQIRKQIKHQKKIKTTVSHHYTPVSGQNSDNDSTVLTATWSNRSSRSWLVVGQPLQQFLAKLRGFPGGSESK